jgi:hypothetical protein
VERTALGLLPRRGRGISHTLHPIIATHLCRRHNFTNKRTSHSLLCKAVLPRRSLALLLMIAFVFAALHVLPWLIHNFSAKP